MRLSRGGRHVCLISVRLRFGGFLGSPSRASPPPQSVCHQSHLSIYLSNFLSVCLSGCPIAGVTCTHVGHGLGGFWDWHWSPVIAIKIIKKVLTVRCFYFRLRLSFLVSPSLSLSLLLSLSLWQTSCSSGPPFFWLPRRSRWQTAPQRMLQVFARLGKTVVRVEVVVQLPQRERQGDGAADEVAAWVEVKHQSKKQQKTDLEEFRVKLLN